MGKKKIIKKYEVEVEEDLNDNYIDTEQLEDDLIYNKLSTLIDIQTGMINYVNKMNLPLCDYLTAKKIECFIADKLCE